MDLKDYFLDVKGEVLGDKPTPGTYASHKSSSGNTSTGSTPLRTKTSGPVLVSSQASVTAASSGSVAHETIDAGKQYHELAATHGSLRALLDQARIGNHKALTEIVNHYGFDPNEIEVTITQPLKDSQGMKPEKFGMRLIRTDEEWNAITRDWETAAVYYPGIELHSVPTTRRNQRLAVVMGITAREFNAVIAAEKRKDRLENELKTLNADIEKGRREMGVDKMPRVPTGADKQPAAPTPPEAKPVAKGAALAKK